MSDVSCIFCKIISRAISSNIILENDSIIVIKDIAPKAPIHYLVIPKKHVPDITALTHYDAALVWDVTQAIKDLALDVPGQAFNLVVNNGAQAGQIIFHLHWHFLAGKNLYSGGFSL